MRLLSLLFFSTVVNAGAQTPLLTFGVTGGLPLQTPLGQVGKWIPFDVGPTVTVRVFSHLSVESGVMYHRLGNESDTATFLYPQNSVTTLFSRNSGWALDIPVLAKVQFRSEERTWRPFVKIGPAIRRTSEHSEFYSSTLTVTPLSGTATALLPANVKRSDWSVDPEVGAGVSFKAGRRFRVEPELRYSYWGSGTTMSVRKNQVTALVGFRF